jgi:hypothetical protein
MKIKLTPEICYIAGLNAPFKEKNAVGVETNIKEIETHFAELAMKLFEVDPTRIMVTEEEGRHSIYFYNSRIAKRLAEIRSKADKLFRSQNDLSRNYLAGMFDSMGRISGSGGVFMNGLQPVDEVFLANMGIHTKGGRIINISSLIALISGTSVLADVHSSLRGA